ncbi:FtsX-like permease family protein [Clostridiales bacterium]|nr:FtsX-like permease family protein [Clostridiales bacterium]
MKKYTLTILREIKQSFGRFAAIIAIVALGVGFLVGILSSTPDMKAAVNAYYDASAMSDFDIKSTMGLTEDDIRTLTQLPQVDQAMPAMVTDALIATDDSERLTARIYGLDFSSQPINQLTILEGRMPQADNECVMEDPNAHMARLSIGDSLTLSENHDNWEDTYTQKEFTIVGIVDNPYYFCNAKEPSSIGNGRASVICYTNDSAYALDAYTDIFLTVKDPIPAFSDEYDEQINHVTAEIEKVSDVRIQARYQEVLAEATEKVDKAKRKLEREKKKAAQELADAAVELRNGRQELANGAARLADAKQQLKDGRAKLQDGKKELKEGKTQLKKGKKELHASKKQLDQARPSVEQAKAAQETGMPLSDEVLSQIKAYEQGLKSWKKGSAQLKSQEKKLKNAQQKIKNNEKQLADAKQQIASQEKQLADARIELAKGQAEYQNAEAEANEEFAKAEKKIRKAERKLKDLKKPEWYILDRDSNVSYARYKIDVEKVASVATVFPIFFFLVAALVSLTTMTRMVEEERIQIGTLKALGYRPLKIMSKYLAYCGTATVMGCAVGLAAGFHLLPAAIYRAYASQYSLPELTFQFNWQYALLSCSLEILCTLGATWLACGHTLREKPAALMIPRAPKAGKRILLERIGFLWKRLSFSYKATARNIFRYKKHLFMTIVGITGCTALMVAGFGMRDSMSEIVKTQFTDLFRYDMRIELAEDDQDSVLTEFLQGKEHVKVRNMNGDVTGTKTKEKISATVYIPEDTEAFGNFVNLRDRKSGAAIPFTEHSAVLTEKMADALELSMGDTFTLMDSDEKSADFTLTGITENYVGCYLYLDPSLYVSAFGDAEYNGYLLKSGITALDEQDETASQLQDSEFVSSAEFMSQSQESYETTLSSIDIIVYILILCAGALAVVVLYNLTNININERSRELATLRVLGYHHSEVARYIFREISLLAILGTLTGLAAGWALHYYVIRTAESVDMMMGRDVAPLSYVLATVITLAFSALVDILMLFKLRRIQMVESMKAVD